MSNFIKLSEAASLAFHTAALLAQRPDRLVSSREMARTLGASENHLSKVLQRLVHAGIVHSTRGPSGGFRIRSSWQRIRLMDIYEAIEGPITPTRCFLNLPVCRGNRCPLGAIVHKTNEAMKKCLSGTTLAEMARSFRPGA
jgi:Rrf2 family nitric oxide-sensitive transcriptional repressor